MALERIADREVEAGSGLVVVLDQRRLRRGKVSRLAGGCLIVLDGVIVLLVVVNLEADIERSVAHVGLREGEHEGAADVAQIALQAERFAEAEEVVGLVIDAQEGAGKAAQAAVHAYGVLALLLNLEQQLHGAGFGILVSFGVLIDFKRFKVLELVEAEQAVLPKL